MFKNTASQKLQVYVFDSTTNLPVTGDAANLTAYVSKNFGSVTVLTDTSATEFDATNAKGYYLFDLTQSETDADTLSFSAKSSTADTVVIAVPAVVYTRPPFFSSLGIASDGDLVKVNTLDGHTAQTGDNFALIGTAGAGLTNLPWNASWDAQVESEVTDALNAYDPPTNTELNARTLPTADYALEATLTNMKGATFDNTTDSLEAIRNRGDAAWVTATGFSTLDASDVRDAVGLVSANLGTQLAGIQSTADDILVDTGTTIPDQISNLNDLSAADVNAEVDIALADYDAPTKVEMDTAFDAVPTATENADALLNRDMSAVSDTNSRSPLNALRFIRNKFTTTGGTLTVTKENDTTTAWTAAISTDPSAEPIIGVDPA